MHKPIAGKSQVSFQMDKNWWHWHVEPHDLWGLFLSRVLYLWFIMFWGSSSKSQKDKNHVLEQLERERGRVGGRKRQEKKREVYGIQSWCAFLQFLIWIQWTLIRLYSKQCKLSRVLCYFTEVTSCCYMSLMLLFNSKKFWISNFIHPCSSHTFTFEILICFNDPTYYPLISMK